VLGQKKRIHPAGMLVILGVILGASILLSLMVGRYDISLVSILKAFSGQEVSEQVSEQVLQIIFQVRLPRIFAAILVGGALSVSGAAYQGMFKNPLVSPDLLGASAGAAFGAILGIMLGIGVLGMKSLAFTFGLLAVLAAWFIGTKVGKGSNTNLLLVLGGILVGGLFQCHLVKSKLQGLFPENTR